RPARASSRTVPPRPRAHVEGSGWNPWHRRILRGARRGGRLHAPRYPDAMTIACDVLVIGAGAAGLMCALGAGRRGRRVRVVERANRPGKKILMSGGGRCNFTNTGTTPANFLSANPHFCKSALARYTPA